MVGQPLAEQGEQLLEQEGRGDDGRSGIEPHRAVPHDPAATAELVQPVHKRYRMAKGTRPQRGGDPAEPRADHDDAATALRSGESGHIHMFVIVQVQHPG